MNTTKENAMETEQQRRARITAEFRIRVARAIVANGPKDHRYESAKADLERLTR